MKRPLIVILVALLFIAAGAVGLIYHLSESRFEPGIILISLIRLLAIVGGVFLLMRQNWARWLLVAWLAFHVAVSAFHSVQEVLAHGVLLAIIAYFLFTPPASKYFSSTSEPSPSA